MEARINTYRIRYLKDTSLQIAYMQGATEEEVTKEFLEKFTNIESKKILSVADIQENQKDSEFDLSKIIKSAAPFVVVLMIVIGVYFGWNYLEQKGIIEKTKHTYQAYKLADKRSPNCLEYDKPYTFKGKIVKKKYSGNRNILELDKAICTNPKDYIEGVSVVKYMQISSGGNRMVNRLVDEDVEVKGSLYHSDNAHHFTKVLINLEEIERKKSSFATASRNDPINSNGNLVPEQKDQQSVQTRKVNSNQPTTSERQELEQLRAEKAKALNEKLVHRDSYVSQKAIDSTEMSGCLKYDKPYAFKGKIVKKVYYDNETGNYNFLALELDKTVCTYPKEYSKGESAVKYMQISSGGNSMVKKLESKNVEIKGTLYHSHTAHHYTKVLISLNNIERNESDAESSRSARRKDSINQNSNFSQRAKDRQQAQSQQSNSRQPANSERQELEQLRAEKAKSERKELEQLRAEKAKKFVLADETLCSSSDDVVLSCNIKQKILSVCHQKDNKFVYKYGKPHKVELTIFSRPLFSHNQFARANVESRLRFHNKGYDYIVYSNDLFTYDKHPYDGTGVYKAGYGVYVVKNNKLLADLRCNKTYPHMKDIYRLRNSFRQEKYSFLDDR